MGDQRIEEGFVGILEIPHEAVLLERGGFGVQAHFPSLPLLFHRANMRRQKSVETERVPFALGKGGPFVQPGMDEEIVSSESYFHGLVVLGV